MKHDIRHTTNFSKITFDLNVIFKNNLLFEQYFILYCLGFNREDLLEHYTKNITSLSSSIVENLIKKGYIVAKKTPFKEITDLEITDNGFSLFGLKPEKKWFEELWLFYPRITPNGRVLKQISKEKACKKYLLRVSTEEEHKNVIKCLSTEITHRSLNNKLNYMQSFETWLNNESWKAYEDIHEQNSEQYGSTLE